MAKGEFGLASGDLPGGGFERIWFREPERISPDEVSFDAGVYLIKRDRANALRLGGSAPINGVTPGEAPADSIKTEAVIDTIEKPSSPTGPRTRTLLLNGSIPPESWNKVGVRLIPKLRSAAQPNLAVSFSLEIDAAESDHLLRELQQILADLGLADRIKIDFT